jgi:dCMP deaminase
MTDTARLHKWDERFIEMAQFVSRWSQDPSTKTGAVIVRPDLTIASVGFNGFPKQMDDDLELYHDRPTKYSRIVHCEMNALIHARCSVEGFTLYTTGMCCDRCVVHMIQAGIARFVWLEDTKHMKSRWSDSFKATLEYLNEAGVDYREVSYSQKGFWWDPDEEIEFIQQT